MASNHDINALSDLLEAHRQTLAIYLKRLAIVGQANATPEVIHGIAEARVEIQRAKNQLRKWGVVAEDLPNNEATRYPKEVLSDFSSKGNFWPTGDYSSEHGLVNSSIFNNLYIWNVKPKLPNRVFHRYPSLPVIRNFDLQCTYQQPYSPHDIAFGLLLRHSSKRYIAFAINVQHQDFYCAVWNSKNGEHDDLIEWSESLAITAERQNTLRVIAKDERLTLFINEQQVATLVDEQPRSGKTGLFLEVEGMPESITLNVVEYQLKELA